MGTESIARLIEAVARALPVLVDAAAKGVMLLAVAAAAVRLMRRTPAAARHLVWLLVMGGLALLPVLSAALPGWGVLPRWARVELSPAAHNETPPADARAAATAADPFLAGPPARSGLPLSAYPPAEVEEPPALAVDAAVAAAPAPEAPSPAEPEASASPATSILPWVSVVWMAGTLLCLLPLVLGRLSLWRLERSSRRIDAGPLADAMRHAQGTIGLKRAVVLLLSGRRAMPMIWGVLRPRLLLPAEAADWSAERLRVVLLHELGHARRLDCLAKLIGHVACAVYWFNPLVWLAHRAMQSEAERACDDVVLAAGSCPADYAEHVLHIAGGLRTGALATHAGIALARPSKLEGRIRSILDARRNRRALTRWAVLIAAVLVAGVAIPLACLGPAKKDVFTGATITLQVDPDSGKYVPTTKPVAVLTVSDPIQFAELLEFFPQLGRESHRAAGWIAGAIIDLSKPDGGKVTIHVSENDDFEVWSAGKGDWPVRGDLKAFLRRLSKQQPATQKADGSPKTFQEILATRPAPDLKTLAERSAQDSNAAGTEGAFYDILKLRDIGRADTVPVLQKILAEGHPRWRIHAHAAAEALFCIDTPDAHKALAEHLVGGRYPSDSGIGYTFSWEMAEPQRSRFIERYLLANDAKDLVVELAAKPIPDKGQIDFTITLRNVSEKPFRIRDRDFFIGDLLRFRSADGRYMASLQTVDYDPLMPKSVELKPGQTRQYQVSARSNPAPAIQSTWLKGATVLLETGRPGADMGDVAHYLDKPGRFDVVAMFEQEPVSKDQPLFGDIENAWSGRAVSKPIQVEIVAPDVRAATEPATQPAARHSIGIYLVNWDLKQTPADKDAPLADLPLETTPLLSEADIFSYDWESHTIRTKGQAAADRILNRKWPHGSFVVVADGERLYRGTMISILSSIVPATPVINIGPTAGQFQPKMAVRIFPPPGGRAPDPRGDERLKRALQALLLMPPDDGPKDKGAGRPDAPPGDPASPPMPAWTGGVLDRPGGKPVAGAKLRAYSEWTRASTEFVTDQNGAYTFAPQAPGPYRLVLVDRPAGVWTEGAVVLVTDDLAKYPTGKASLVRVNQGEFAETKDAARTRPVDPEYVVEAAVLSPGQARRLPDLHLALPQCISGTVKDEAGQPVAGAQISLLSAAMARAEMVTDAKGQYRLYTPPRRVPMQCVGTVDRYYAQDPGDKYIAVAAGQEVGDTDFKLVSAPPVTGEVVLPDGKKAPAGLDVWVIVSWSDPREAAGLVTGFKIADRHVNPRVKTDAQGNFVAYLLNPYGPGGRTQFRLDWIQAFVWSPDGRLAGSAELRGPNLPGPSDGLKIVLDKAGSAVVQVVAPDGTPVIGAKVAVRPAAGGRGFGADVPPLPVEDLGQGRYRVNGLVSNLPHRYYVQADGLRDERPGDRKPIIAKPGEEVQAEDAKLTAWGKNALPRWLAHAERDQGIIYNIGQLGPDAAPAVSTLTDILRNSPDKEKRRLAAQALGRIGPAAKPAAPALIVALEKDDPQVARYAAEGLGLIGERQAVRSVEAALKAGRIDRPTAETALWRLAAAPGGTAASPPATEPADVSKDNIAWGKANRGVSIGLATHDFARKPNVPIGDKLGLCTYARNETDKPLEFTFVKTPAKAWTPKLSGNRVELPGGTTGSGRVSQRTVTLKPGDTTPLDTVWFLVQQPDWKGETTEAVLRLKPGTYRFTYGPMVIGPDAPSPTSGELEVTVIPADAPATQPAEAAGASRSGAAAEGSGSSPASAPATRPAATMILGKWKVRPGQGTVLTEMEFLSNGHTITRHTDPNRSNPLELDGRYVIVGDRIEVRDDDGHDPGWVLTIVSLTADSLVISQHGRIVRLDRVLAQPTTAPAADAGPSTSSGQAEIARLIKQVGSDKFAERDAAQAALVKIGQPAAAALESAAADKDAEISQGAKAALKQIAADAALKFINLYQQQGKFAQAADACRDFIRDYPTSARLPEAHLVMGELLERLGRQVEAADAYRTFLKSAAEKLTAAAGGDWEIKDKPSERGLVLHASFKGQPNGSIVATYAVYLSPWTAKSKARWDSPLASAAYRAIASGQRCTLLVTGTEDKELSDKMMGALGLKRLSPQESNQPPEDPPAVGEPAPATQPATEPAPAGGVAAACPIVAELSFEKKAGAFAPKEQIVLLARFRNTTDEAQVYRGGLAMTSMKSSCQIQLTDPDGKVWSAEASALKQFYNYKDIELPARGSVLIGQWDLTALAYNPGSQYRTDPDRKSLADLSRPGRFRVSWWDGHFQGRLALTSLRSAPIAFSIEDAPTSPATQPASAPAAGEAVEGLKCSLSLKPAALKVGDEITIEAEFRNVSGNPLSFHYPPDYAARLLVFRDAAGREIRNAMTGITEGWMRNKPFRTLGAGETFKASFVGKLAYQSKRTGWGPPAGGPPVAPEPPVTLTIDFRGEAMRFDLLEPGRFTVALRLASDERTIAALERAKAPSPWKAALSSNAEVFQVTAATRAELDAAIATVKNGPAERRGPAIRLLAAHMDAKAAAALLEVLLKAPGEELRDEAAAGLQAIGDPSVAKTVLAEYRKTESPAQRRRLLNVMEASTDWTQQWELYLDIAKSGKPQDERVQAFDRLTLLGRPEIVQVLIAEANSGEPRRQRAGIDFISSLLALTAYRDMPKFQNPKRIPTPETEARLADELIGLLKRDKDHTVRGRAAQALGHASGEKVVAALVEALKDEDASVGFYAAGSLGQVGGPEAIPALEQYMRDAPKDSQKDAARRAIEAIRARSKAAAPASPPATQSAAAAGPDAVVDSLADALAAIAAKHPELANYQKGKAKLFRGPPTYSTRMFGLSFANNFTRPASKRAIRPSDFGAQGLYIEFLCGAMPEPGSPLPAMAPPALVLKNLRLYVWTDVKTGAGPSAGLVEDVTGLLRSHMEKLKELDDAAGQQPARPAASAPATPPAMAWGKTVNGLQAGLRFDVQDRTYRAGEGVGFVLLVRNTGDKPLTVVDYVPMTGWAPTVRTAEGKPVPIAVPPVDRPVQERKREVKPGEVLEVGTVFLQLDADAEARGDRPHAHFLPGKYVVSQTYRFAEAAGSTWSGELTTGEITLSVAAAEGAAESKAPAPGRLGTNAGTKLTPEQEKERDKLLAEADRKFREGLKELAKTFPQLAVANNKPLDEALKDDPARPGNLGLFFGRGNKPSKAPWQPETIADAETWSLLAVIRPEGGPVTAMGMTPLYPHLGLVGQCHGIAGDPKLAAALTKLLTEALAPLKALDEQVGKSQPDAGEPATGPAATAPADAPEWVKAAAGAMRGLGWEVERFDKKPSFAVNGRQGSWLVLRQGSKQYTDLQDSQKRGHQQGTYTADELDELRKAKFVMRYRRLEVAVFQGGPLAADAAKKLTWAEWEDELPYFKKPVHLGEGLGSNWYAKATIFDQEWLRQGLGLKGGDDRLALLTEAMSVEDQGSMTRNSCEQLLAAGGDKAIPYIKAAVEQKKGFEAIRALAFIRTDAATEYLKELYRAEATRPLASYALIHKPYRKAAKEQYLDMLRQRKMREFEPGEACVEFGWKEAVPLLEEVYLRPKSIWEFEAAFRAKRALEGRPVPAEIDKAQKQLRQWVYSKEPPTREELAAAKASLLAGKDTEAATVLAIPLTMGAFKASGERLLPIQTVAREVLRELPRKETAEIVERLAKALAQEDSDERTAKKLLEILSPESDEPSRPAGTVPTRTGLPGSPTVPTERPGFPN